MNPFAMLGMDHDKGDGSIMGEQVAWVGTAPVQHKRAWPSDFDVGWALKKPPGKKNGSSRSKREVPNQLKPKIRAWLILRPVWSELMVMEVLEFSFS